MTKVQPAVQHKYATRKQKAALESLIEEPRSQVPAEDQPRAYVRAKSTSSGPMAIALAAINLAALQHSGSEKEHTLLALTTALEKVENEIQLEEESREFVRNDEMELVEEDVPNSMCSKIPFVEMMFEEAQKVDRASLRVLLRYIGDVAKAFDDELDSKDREAEKAEDGTTGGRTEVPQRRHTSTPWTAPSRSS